MTHTAYISAAALALLLAACSADPDLYAPQAEPDADAPRSVVDVPYTVALGGAWSTDTDGGTRVPPPGVGDGSGGGITVTDAQDDGVAEIENVNAVHVFAFKRKSRVADYLNSDQQGDTMSSTQTDWPDDEDGFVYDALNDTVITNGKAIQGTDTLNLTPHKQVQFTGTLHKAYGYEYRLIAIGYSTKRELSYYARRDNRYTFFNFRPAKTEHFTYISGEEHWFEIDPVPGKESNAGKAKYDGLALKDFAATIYREHIGTDNNSIWWEFLAGTHHTSVIKADQLSRYITQPPQFFYGTLSVGGRKDLVIPYAERDQYGDYNAELPLSGRLYRAMAKVEVKIKKIKQHHFPGGIKDREVEWVALCVDNVITKVGLNSYDRFNFASGYNACPEKARDARYDAIDVCQVRPIKDRDETGPAPDGSITLTAYMVPCRTRLALRVRYEDGTGILNGVRWGQICVSDDANEGTATGVISQNTKDNKFILRRNHKYVITVDDTEYIFKHELD